MQLGFAVWPLLRFTGVARQDGRRFVNPPIIKVLGWTTALIIIGLNVKLLFDTFIPESWRIAIYGRLTRRRHACTDASWSRSITPRPTSRCCRTSPRWRR